jgi:hypothetical protein
LKSGWEQYVRKRKDKHEREFRRWTLGMTVLEGEALEVKMEEEERKMELCCHNIHLEQSGFFDLNSSICASNCPVIRKIAI